VLQHKKVGERAERDTLRGRPASAPPATATYSLYIPVRAFAVFGDKEVDPRRHNGQRYRAELEHGIVESAEPRIFNGRSRAASITTADANDAS
jgi:hypothetical protein